MTLALYPAIQLGKTEQGLESISRLSTGLNILGGGGDLAQEIGLKTESQSYRRLASVANESRYSTYRICISRISLLSKQTKRINSDTATTNSASDTAALNAEASAVSDTLDDIVTALNFNNIAVLGTSTKTFNVPKDVDGNTTAMKTTDGIAATNITDQQVQIPLRYRSW